MAYELTDIPKVTGRNTPGMSEQIYIAAIKDILAFPPIKTPTDPVTPGDSIVLDGDITFEEASGLGFHVVYTTQDTTKLLLERTGQKDSRSFKVDFEFFTPGLNKTFIEHLLAEPDIIALVKKRGCDSNEYVCLGNNCEGVRIEGSYDSGETDGEDSRNGWEARITGYVATPLFYSGEITLATENTGG